MRNAIEPPFIYSLKRNLKLGGESGVVWDNSHQQLSFDSLTDTTIRLGTVGIAI
jgi:hypothetical protein